MFYGALMFYGGLMVANFYSSLRKDVEMKCCVVLWRFITTKVL